MMVANRLGTAIAANRKPVRTAIVASTSRLSGASTGEVTAAIAASTRPVGHRNQPDLPKSVTNAKAAWTQPGSCFAAAASGASANTIATATRRMVARPAARTRARVPGTALKRGEAASTVIAALTLARAQRGQETAP